MRRKQVRAAVGQKTGTTAVETPNSAGGPGDRYTTGYRHTAILPQILKNVNHIHTNTHVGYSYLVQTSN